METIAVAKSKEDMAKIALVLPRYVVVRVSPFILTELIGRPFVDDAGDTIRLDSVYFYRDGEIGPIEAEPVMKKTTRPLP